MRLIELLGVGVFAISGALAAGRKSLDLLGVLVVAAVTAIGGGTVRDLLLGRRPFWLFDPIYLYVIILAALAILLYTRWRRPPERLLLLADALGLALFSISGARIAQQAHSPAIVVILMATLTGVAGGVIRDVLCAEIPLILRRGRIYATAAIAGAVLYLVAQRLGAPRGLAETLGMLGVAGLRLGAIARGWTLPVFELRDSSETP